MLKDTMSLSVTDLTQQGIILMYNHENNNLSKLKPIWLETSFQIIVCKLFFLKREWTWFFDKKKKIKHMHDRKHLQKLNEYPWMFILDQISGTIWSISVCSFSLWPTGSIENSSLIHHLTNMVRQFLEFSLHVSTRASRGCCWLDSSLPAVPHSTEAGLTLAGRHQRLASGYCRDEAIHQGSMSSSNDKN